MLDIVFSFVYSATAPGPIFSFLNDTVIVLSNVLTLCPWYMQKPVLIICVHYELGYVHCAFVSSHWIRPVIKTRLRVTTGIMYFIDLVLFCVISLIFVQP